MRNLTEDVWMTQFYGKKWYKTESPDFEILKAEDGLVECRIESIKPRLVQKSIEIGFEMVETLIEFETEVKLKKIEIPTYLRLAHSNDLPEILDLVDSCFIKNDKFYNRLKNPKYFTPSQSAEYFRKSVANFFFNSTAITVVAELEGRIIGYFLMRCLEDGKYKGVSTGVHSNWRGKGLHIHMQNKISEIIGKSYQVINTTQISNYTVINNHIMEKKKLSKIEHILFLDLRTKNI